MLVYDGKAYFGTSVPGFMHAVDAKTGKSVFDLPSGAPVFASMALAGDTLYLGNFVGKLTAIDLKTQKPTWVFETDGAKQNAASMTNADGSIRFETVFSSPNHKLFTMGTILSSPVVVDDTVYFGSTDGNLYAVR